MTACRQRQWSRQYGHHDLADFGRRSFAHRFSRCFPCGRIGHLDGSIEDSGRHRRAPEGTSGLMRAQRSTTPSRPARVPVSAETAGVPQDPSHQRPLWAMAAPGSAERDPLQRKTTDTRQRHGVSMHVQRSCWVRTGAYLPVEVRWLWREDKAPVLSQCAAIVDRGGRREPSRCFSGIENSLTLLGTGFISMARNKRQLAQPGCLTESGQR